MEETNSSVGQEAIVVQPTKTPLQKLKNKIPHVQKRYAPLVIILIAIPVTVVLALTSQTFFNHAAGPDVKLPVSRQVGPPKIHGYIIEFKSVPITKSSRQINKSNLIAENSRVENDQVVAQKDVLNRLGKKSFSRTNGANDSVKLLGRYKYAINGVGLDITKDQADKLKSSLYIKAIYPNYEVKPTLMDSVPLIGADKVWQNIKDQNGNSVTGKGINIAILDTGVDYAHPDLGHTDLVERNFTKINSDALDLSAGKTFALNSNRIAYSSNAQIEILDLTNGSKRMVSLLGSGGGANNLFLDKNILAYTRGGILYFYNLDNGAKGSIDSLPSYEKFGVSSGKVVYSFRNTAKVYDIASGIKTTIPHASTDIGSQFSLSGGNAAFFSNTVTEKDSTGTVISICSGKIVLVNLSTLARTEILVPNLGKIVDYDSNSNKILYSPCEKSDYTSYSLYDIGSGQTTSVSDSSPNPEYPYSEAQEGKIASPSLIYFTNPANKINVLDFNRNKKFKINIFLKAYDMQAEGNKVCFVSDDVNIYCHDYDQNYDYPYPQNIFNSKVIGGFNFINNNSDPLDDVGHGSHVAAIAAGNGVLRGVAPGANIIAYKVLSVGGSSDTVSTVISAIDSAIQTRSDSDSINDINIMNLSLGYTCTYGYDGNCGPNDILSKAIDNATQNGILSVVSAGNNGSSQFAINSPGTARSAITVGSVNKQKQISSFSSQGPVLINGETINKPDVLAPGETICAALGNNYILGTGYSKCLDDSHVSLSGTSMAAPHVAGIAALILQLHPDWTPQQVKDVIRNNADDLGYDINTQGSGFVNTQKIFDSLVIPTQTPTPSVAPTPTDLPTPTLTDTPTPTLTPTNTPTLNPTDTPTLIPTQAPLAGDFNGDKNVDLADYNIWKSEFLGLSSGTNADANKDGAIDLVDYIIWHNNYHL